MKISTTSSHPSRRTTASRRAQLLAAFERSGMSAAAFARQYHISYTTFLSWRQGRAKPKATVAFAEVEMSAAAASAELVVELGAQACLRLRSEGQVALAARLLQQLNPSQPC